MSPLPRFILPALLISLLAGASHAGDLSGTWKGRFSCTIHGEQGLEKRSDRSVTTPDPGVSTLELVQPDGADTAALLMLIDGAVYSGFVLDPGPATKGTGAIVDCGEEDQASGYDEVRSFRWKTNPNSIMATIVWHGLLVGGDDEVGTCHGKWHRVSRDEPTIEASCE